MTIIQLPQVLIRNSFNILGLSSSAALKEIRKRFQELLQFVKIEEIQEFEADIGPVRELRNESEVRMALERISGIKERLREVFFWFDDHNIENQKAIAMISHGNYQEAVDILKKTDKPDLDWLEYKNLALALMFKAFAFSAFDSFDHSLKIWKRIAESEDFWGFYEKHYILHDELGTSLSIFHEFRSSIYEPLSAKAVSFYHQTKNPEVIGFFYFVFGQIGQSIDKEVLQPFIFKIKKEIEDLEGLAKDLMADVSNELAERPPIKSSSGISPTSSGENGTIVSKKILEDMVKKSLKKIHNYFIELDKFKLTDYSPLVVLRNSYVENLIDISIKIYNQNRNIEISFLFLDEGSKLVTSDAIGKKIKEEIQEFEAHLRLVREWRNKSNIRSESEVQRNLERISGIKERLREVFFWFDDQNIENQKVITMISQGNYQEAVDILKKTDKPDIDWLEYKNWALALMFQAFAFSAFDCFGHSLKIWKHIAESEDFWGFCEKHYLLPDEVGISLSHEFRSSIYEPLSDKTVSFYRQTKNPEVIGFYYFVFGQIGQSIDKEILQPLILKIKKEIENLEGFVADLKSSSGICLSFSGKNGKIVSKEILEDLVKKSLKKIHNDFFELDKFKLTESSPLAILRNDYVEKLSAISIQIYNQNCGPEISFLFLDKAFELATSHAMANKIKSAEIKIRGFLLWKTIANRFEKLIELVEMGEIKKANKIFLILDNELMQQNDETSKSVRVNLLVSYCYKLTNKSCDIFYKKKFDIQNKVIDGILNWQNRNVAIFAVIQALEIIKERIHLLVFVKPAQDLLTFLKKIDTIRCDCKKISDISLLFEYLEFQSEVIDVIASKQENENTKMAIKLYGSANYYWIYFFRIRDSIRWAMWKTIGYGAVFVFMIFLVYKNYHEPEPGFSKKTSNRTNSSYSTSPSQTLTVKERAIIESMQKNKPDVLNKIRKQGFSDKQIAQHVMEQAEKRKNDNT